MKIVLYILSIVLTGSLVLSISSCGDESLTTEVDTMVSIVTPPPIKEPIAPPPTVPVTPSTEEIFLFVDPSQIESPPAGDQLNISIRINNVTRSFVGYRVDVDFDPMALKFVRAGFRGETHRDNNTFEVISSVSSAVANTDGTHRVILKAKAEGGEAFAQNGTLATLTFEVVAVKSSIIQLNNVDFFVNHTITIGSTVIHSTRSLPVKKFVSLINVP